MADTASPAIDKLGFDPESLRTKYREERDKRMRSDGFKQYVAAEVQNPHFVDDPYADPNFTRAPLTDEVEVVVIGGGFGGLLLGARLRQADVQSIRIIEKGGDFGGTWYWNRYPGAACDVESYVYLPLLEELGHMPSRKYAPGEEIREHCQAIARAFDLYRDACLQTLVTELRWDTAASRWIVSTNRGDKMRARFVVMANGPLHHAKLSAIPGIERFKGHSFHTGRWDYAYTGGNADGGMDRLGDKVVGVIGTGATAVQCIPHLAASAKQLYVFQRTPSSIDVRNDKLTDEEWVKSLEPGWHQQRIENFTALTSGIPAEIDLVNDGWTEIIANIRLLAQEAMARGESLESAEVLAQLADMKKMESIRARVDSIVQDKATAEALKPYYNQFCKRPCFHDEYLSAFNRPNVTLVDTEGKGVERITENGVVAQGKEYPLDCIVYATGFEVGVSFQRRNAYEIYGEGNVALSDKWAEGASTLHGFQTRGFPNCFVISHIQAGAGVNFVHILDEQAKHVAYILGETRKAGAVRVETSQAAEDAWVEEILRVAGGRAAFLEACTPGYYNYEGNAKAMNARNRGYEAGSTKYLQVLKEWRKAGNMAGVELTKD